MLLNSTVTSNIYVHSCSLPKWNMMASVSFQYQREITTWKFTTKQKKVEHAMNRRATCLDYRHPQTKPVSMTKQVCVNHTVMWCVFVFQLWWLCAKLQMNGWWISFMVVWALTTLTIVIILLIVLKLNSKSSSPRYQSHLLSIITISYSPCCFLVPVAYPPLNDHQGRSWCLTIRLWSSPSHSAPGHHPSISFKWPHLYKITPASFLLLDEDADLKGSVHSLI